MTEKDLKNRKNIEIHEANGVEIPYHQNVVIEDDVLGSNLKCELVNIKAVNLLACLGHSLTGPSNR